MSSQPSGSTPAGTVSNIRPAVVTVGDELVFGERGNDNQLWLLRQLRERGWPAEVALVLPDAAAIIARWLKSLLSGQCHPILVSGGLGGTHDDCTREGIAMALDVPLSRHEVCFEILKAKYGRQFTAGRQRMALLPEGCELIANPIGAPGFAIGGIHAFPGFPNMLQPMATAVMERVLPEAGERAWLVREYQLPLSEGVIARDIEEFVTAHGEVRIGLYPHAGQFPHALTIRFRCPPHHLELVEAFDQLVVDLKNKHGVHD